MVRNIKTYYTANWIQLILTRLQAEGIKAILLKDQMGSLGGGYALVCTPCLRYPVYYQRDKDTVRY